MAETEKKVEHIVQDLEDGGAVIAVPEGELLTIEEPGETPPDKKEPEDARPPGEQDGEEDDDGEEEVTLKRQFRKEERQRKKEMRDLAIQKAKLQEQHANRLAAEVEALKAKLAEVDRRTTGTEISAARQQLNEAAMEEQYYRSQRIKARTDNNPEVEAEAEEKLYAARQKKEKLAAAIEQVSKTPSRPAPAAPVHDPETVAMARQWHSRNSWYKPNGIDETSRLVKALDEAVASEGYDPKSAAYYSELDKRIAKYLPEKQNTDTTQPSDQRPNKMVVTGSGRESPSAKPNEFRLSPDRVRAMKDAGAWDDPALRMKMVKQYAAFDRQNKATR